MMDVRDKHKGSDRNTNQKQLTEQQKRLYPVASTDGDVQLHVINQLLNVTNDEAMTISLPPVAEAKGLTYYIVAHESGGDVTVTNFPNETYEDSNSWLGDYLLTDEL